MRRTTAALLYIYDALIVLAACVQSTGKSGAISRQHHVRLLSPDRKASFYFAVSPMERSPYSKSINSLDVSVRHRF